MLVQLVRAHWAGGNRGSAEASLGVVLPVALSIIVEFCKIIYKTSISMYKKDLCIKNITEFVLATPPPLLALVALHAPHFVVAVLLLVLGCRPAVGQRDEHKLAQHQEA
jgi:hypothetical protein